MPKARKLMKAPAIDTIIRDPDSHVEISAHSSDGATEFRRQHDQFIRTAEYEGKQARKVDRAVDTLGALLISGKITQAQHTAGVSFREAFTRAHLDPLRAADLNRLGGGWHEESAKAAAAREHVRKMLAQLGGMSTPIGLAAWYVIGAGYTYTEFARRQRWGKHGTMDRKTATALTVGALAVWGGDANNAR